MATKKEESPTKKNPKKKKGEKKVILAKDSTKKTHAALMTVVAEIKKVYGPRGIYIGDEIKDTFDHRLKSDIFGINVNSGGGIPYNGIAEIHGPESSFKTTICLGFVKEAQKEHGSDCVVVWVATEDPPDPDWARHLGVKIPYSDDELKSFKAVGIPPDDIKLMKESQEGCGMFMVLASGFVEQDLDKAKKLMNTGGVKLYVLDSAGAVSTEKEREDGHGDANVALNPKMLSIHVRYLHSFCNTAAARGWSTAILIVNQLRSKIGGWSPSGDPTEIPGGRQLKHGKSIAFSCRIAGFLTTSGKVWGKQIAITVEKSKICIPHRTSTVMFIIRDDNPRGLPVGPDIYVQTVELAQSLDIIYWSGSKWMFGEGELTYKGEKVKKEDLALALQEDDDLLQMVQDEILHKNRILEISQR